MESPDGNIHVIPLDRPDHIESKECFCEPELSYKDSDTDKEVWVHRQMQ